MLGNSVSTALVLGTITVAFGGYLALGFLLGRTLPARRIVTALHGLGAAAVLGVLLWAGAMTPATASAGPDFLSIGFWVLAPAAVLGLAALASRRAKRPLRGLAIGAHASVAIFGVTVLLAAAAM